MFRSYLIVTARKLYRHKLYALINILGLALGIACFTVLFLLILHEINYDKFHTLASRTYRVTEVIERQGVGERAASVPFPVGTALARDFPFEIERAVRLFNFQYPSLVVEYNKHKYNEKKFFFADSSFFQVFSFSLKEGDAKHALSRPNTVVITEHIRQKYFGSENPIGKKIFFQGTVPLEITGIFEEKPVRSHIDFDFIASFSTLNQLSVNQFFDRWVWNPCWTYIVLRKNVKPERLEAKLPEFVRRHFESDIKDKVELQLQPLKRIHLHSALDYEIGSNGDIRYIYIFSVISVLVLIIAALNFINLSTARSSLRAREVVVRKMAGADKAELMSQFLLESVLLSSFSILFAFIIVELASPFLSDLSGNPLHPSLIHSPTMILLVLVSGIGVGVLSGIYPAYFLSSFEPTEVFQGKIVIRDRSKWFRRVMVVIQFSISTFLLITTSFTFRQLHYLRSTRLGFDKDHIVILPIVDAHVLNRYSSFKQALLESKTAVAVTYMEEVIGKTHQTHEYHPEGVPKDKLTVYPSLKVGYDFIKTFNIRLLAGRDFMDSQQINRDYMPHLGVRKKFSEWSVDDKTGAVIINQAMVKHLGWQKPDSAIGRRFASREGEERVVGVVEDFHFSSLHTSVTPFVINLSRGKADIASTKYIAIKVERNRMEEVLPSIAEIWEEHVPDTPFDYFFLEDNLDKQYLKEQKLSEISAVFSIVAITIACMGLFGLASFVVEQRQKEIGIRKTLGATNLQITFMLSQKFVIVVGVSILLAWMLSFLVLSQWLNTFPYRIAMTAEVFLLNGFIILSIALLTVSYHTIKVAFKEPIDSIKQK